MSPLTSLPFSGAVLPVKGNVTFFQTFSWGDSQSSPMGRLRAPGWSEGQRSWAGHHCARQILWPRAFPQRLMSMEVLKAVLRASWKTPGHQGGRASTSKAMLPSSSCGTPPESESPAPRHRGWCLQLSLKPSQGVKEKVSVDAGRSDCLSNACSAFIIFTLR